MDQTCIVVANAGRARIYYQAAASGPLLEATDMVNSAVRLRNAELESDGIGPKAAGKSMHGTGGALPTKAYEPPQTPTERETELFARSVIAFLQEQYQKGTFQQLALVASPEFLGLLRNLLSPQLKSALSWEINKDYTQFSGQQLRDQLAQNKQKQND